MLAYTAHRKTPVERRPAPNAMLVIVAVHVAAIAALMSAKMDIPLIGATPPTVIDFIREPDPPAQRETPAKPTPRSTLDQPAPIVPTPTLDTPTADPTPVPLPDLGRIIGPAVDSLRADPLPLPAPVRIKPQLMTPAARLKPPYPISKLASGEEGLLRLRLSIDATGRVTAVEAVGPADRAFLEAARRHLIAHWRYRPATENGRALATTTVITLRFQLDA